MRRRTYLLMSQTGDSGRKATSINGSSGKKAPGRDVSRQGRSEPMMYMMRLPELAAAGIRMVRLPLREGVEISLRYMEAMGTPAPIPTPLITLQY